LSSEDSPNTEEGANWTVVVFRCPRKNWIQVLRRLYFELDKQGKSFIPHYKLRWEKAQPDYWIVSFRILRRQEQEEEVKS
jgi:hypothetical protein